MLAKLDTLKALFALGAVELVLADRLSLGFTAERISFQTAMDGPAIAATSATVTITLEVLDPALYELEPQVIGFSATRAALPTGTATSDCLIRVSGPYTNPVITYRDATGAAVHTIGLTATAADTTQYHEIDVAQMLITKSVAGVMSADAGAETSGDLEDFVISPTDGDVLAGVYPTIEVSGLGAGGSAEILYNRQYQ